MVEELSLIYCIYPLFPNEMETVKRKRYHGKKSNVENNIYFEEYMNQVSAGNWANANDIL